MLPRPGILAGVLFALLTVVTAEDSYQKSLDKEAQADIEAFNRLLDQVDPPSLHAALHDYSPKKFKHGMFKEDRTAVEAIHHEQPSLASSIVAKAKRQDIPTNGTTPVSPTTSLPAGDVSISTPAVDSPTNVLGQPPATPQPSSTDAGPSPSTSAVATPNPIGPVQGSVIGSSAEVPTTTVGGSPGQPPATTTSTSTSPNAPIVGSSSGGSSAGSSNGTPGSSAGGSSSGSTDGRFPTTSAGGSSSPSGDSSSPSGTNSFTGGSTPSLTAGQLVTTTNAEGVTIVSTIGGGYVTLSRSAGGGSSSPTITSGSTRTTRRPSSTSVVLQTTTLPDGSQSTVTAITVVPGESAAATPSGEAGTGGGSGSPNGNASLQNGVAAGITGGMGWEIVCLLGGAIGVAMMM
ncbi:MAG: hypothetical protein Q9223_007217 [Gallowayella weberi]